MHTHLSQYSPTYYTDFLFQSFNRELGLVSVRYYILKNVTIELTTLLFKNELKNEKLLINFINRAILYWLL